MLYVCLLYFHLLATNVLRLLRSEVVWLEGHHGVGKGVFMFCFHFLCHDCLVLYILLKMHNRKHLIKKKKNS